MAFHDFKCTNEECLHVFNVHIPEDTPEQQRLEQTCEKCGSIAKRVWGIGGMYVKQIRGMARRKIGGKKGNAR